MRALQRAELHELKALPWLPDAAAENVHAAFQRHKRRLTPATAYAAWTHGAVRQRLKQRLGGSGPKSLEQLFEVLSETTSQLDPARFLQCIVDG